MSIGSKIKSLRKKRGITQNELANGIVTRGMLSRIESESAMPSMQSLCAIAKKLEVSPSFLLEEGNDILPAELERIAKAIEKEYKEKHFRNCLEIFDLWQIESNIKFSPIYVSCAFEVALDSFYNGDFIKCRELLLKINEILPNALLIPSNVTKARIDFLITVMDNIDTIDNAISLSSDTADFEFSPSLFFSLLKLLKNSRHSDCLSILSFCRIDDIYRRFVEAQLLIKDYKFIDAIIEYKNLLSLDRCPVFFKLLCFVSTENCCKLCEDYKGAYENHLAYQELLSKIKR